MGSFIKKQSDKWFLEHSLLEKELKAHKISRYDYISVEEYVLNIIFNDFRFKLFILDEIKNNGYFYYEFPYFPESEATPYLIIVANNVIKEWLPKRNKFDILGEKLEHYMCSEYISNTFLSKKITGYDVTYKKIINLLCKSPELFSQSIPNNDYCGMEGTKLIEILSNKPFGFHTKYQKESILNYINLSKEEINNIYANFLILDYCYAPDLMAQQQFVPFEDLVDNFEINPKLKTNILCEIPYEFSDLQKAYYVYKRLCQKFSYDEEYYYLLNYGKEENSTIKHQSFERIETLEGGEDVTCTEFSLIFAKFLRNLNIPFKLLGYKNQKVDKIDSKHIKVRFKAGDYIVNADGAHLITKSDMVFEKIYGQTNFFNVINEHKRTQDFFEKEIKEVDDYFINNKELMEYSDAKEMYEKLYVNSSKKLSFSDKLKLILDIIDAQNLKFIDMISFVTAIQKNIFSEELDKIQIEFFVNNSEGRAKLNILVCYNGIENKLTEQITENNYIVITPDKEKFQISYDEIKYNFEKGIYDFTSQGRNMLDLKGGCYEQGIHPKRNK